MLKKLAAVLIIAAIVSALGGTSAFPQNPANSDDRTETPKPPSEAAAKKEVKPNEQLKTNMLKLVADAKAGKVAPVAKSQIQPATSNHWSKKTKIVVGVGAAVAVVVVILVVQHVRHHLFDNLRLSN